MPDVHPVSLQVDANMIHAMLSTALSLLCALPFHAGAAAVHKMYVLFWRCVVTSLCTSLQVFPLQTRYTANLQSSTS